MQLFGDILKQKEIKDREGCGNLTSNGAVRRRQRHGQHSAGRKLKQ